MFSELEKRMDNYIDGRIEAEKALNEVFYDGDVRVSKDDLNHLLYYNNKLYDIAMMFYEMLDGGSGEGIVDECTLEGAKSLINKYNKEHRSIVNRVALERLTGKIDE